MVASLLLGVAAGCSDDDDPEPAAATTTTEPTAGSSTTETTAALGTSTTAAAGPACVGEPLGPVGDEASSVEGDVDGDGTADVVTVFLATDGWHLRADLATGGVLDELLATQPLDQARALAAGDLDADGAAEVWAQVGTGAAATVVGLFAADGCDLEAVLLDGRPVELAVGGTVTLLNGVACGDGGVTHLTATSEDGVTYTTLDLTYELQDGSLVRVGEEAGTLDATDPALAEYSDFGC